MYRNKRHIFFFNLVTIILVAALLTPSIVKFNHIFEDHKHEVCETPQTNHFHELDMDCEFYKFKLSAQFSFSPNPISFSQYLIPSKKIVTQYIFISDYQQLHFDLRGPPALV